LGAYGSAEPRRDRADPVLLRVVDEPGPFPTKYPIARQPLTAFDLLD
jgi:hypothetical protein